MTGLRFSRLPIRYCSNTAAQAGLKLPFFRRRQVVIARVLGISPAQILWTIGRAGPTLLGRALLHAMTASPGSSPALTARASSERMRGIIFAKCDFSHIWRGASGSTVRPGEINTLLTTFAATAGSIKFDRSAQAENKTDLRS